MEERSSVIVCSVNIGNLINTRRVLEGCIIEAISIVFVISPAVSINENHQKERSLWERDWAFPGRSPRIRHRNELTVRAWEKAEQGLGK